MNSMSMKGISKISYNSDRRSSNGNLKKFLVVNPISNENRMGKISEF